MLLKFQHQYMEICLSEKVITDDKYTEQEIASTVQGRF